MKRFLGQGQNLCPSSDNAKSLNTRAPRNSWKLFRVTLKHTPHPQIWYKLGFTGPDKSFRLFVCLFRAAQAASGSSQAKGLIRAADAGLCHSHSNLGSLTHWLRAGIKPASSWIQVGLVAAEPRRELLVLINLKRPFSLCYLHICKFTIVNLNFYYSGTPCQCQMGRKESKMG